MSNEQAAPETKGVTTELLATVDLGPEIEGIAGRDLRMRMVTIEPGGVFGPIHDHKGRPGMVYVLQGTITDHRDGVATDYGPGPGWPEDPHPLHPAGGPPARRGARRERRPPARGGRPPRAGGGAAGSPPPLCGGGSPGGRPGRRGPPPSQRWCG